MRRYAGDDARWIVVVGGLSAPARRPRRKWVREPDAAPLEVDVTTVTVIDAARLEEAAAGEWLAAAGESEVTAALEVLNQALHGHRVAAADPQVSDATLERSLKVRVGYGDGEQVAEGRWAEVREISGLGSSKRDRSAALRPQERLAAMLSGRDVALACELLCLRARADLDHGRSREAAMQLHLALEAGLVELRAFEALSGLKERLEELAQLRDDVASAANAALQGGLEPEVVESVTHALDRLEAALRAKSAAGPY